MYLCGIIPGLKKPSLEQINNFLCPLVNELLEFWQPGVFFSSMAAEDIADDGLLTSGNAARPPQTQGDVPAN
ncbi:hypothetical protein EDD17DRAFT_1754034 [Pisolithus thermaeus]|nr:hypothetical protein EV401DRAFT_2084889 [Pisolithus croceorrhizus]KAI6165341.1 hypothetical protein EDD17DRAFT_1754034 [Pisolithus thermaeus]